SISIILKLTLSPKNLFNSFRGHAANTTRVGSTYCSSTFSAPLSGINEVI
ncbi:hypothetical protein PanWU01x14_161230, partial [Parasponia andersonii]